MNQNVKIKLGNVTNLSDARFAAAAGIDYMGFCFDPQSVSYIPPVKAKEIIDWTTGCFVVAEFGNQTMKEAASVTKDPVCGMSVDPSAALHAERDGETFHFCGESCRAQVRSVKMKHSLAVGAAGHSLQPFAGTRE